MVAGSIVVDGDVTVVGVMAVVWMDEVFVDSEVAGSTVLESELDVVSFALRGNL